MRLKHSSRSYRGLAADIVAESVGDVIRNRKSPHVPIEDICRTVGIRQVLQAPMHVEGCLTSVPGGLAVLVNSESTVPRQRFTIAHEVGHVVLSRYEGKPIERKCRAVHYSNEEELLVDMIAAEILMPAQELNKLVRSLPKDWEAIEHLVWTYQVSYTAAIRRLLDLDSVMGVWVMGNQATSDSLSARCSESIYRIMNGREIWNAFCRNPNEGKSHWLEVLVRNSHGKVNRDRLRGQLKYMSRVGARSGSDEPPKNCWILAWAECSRPMVQLRLDFGFEFG